MTTPPQRQQAQAPEGAAALRRVTGAARCELRGSEISAVSL